MLQMQPAQPAHPSFNVVFTYQQTAKVILLSSHQDVNDATIALENARCRLIQAQVQGELRLMQHGDTIHTLLRESLGRTDP